jgi:hypothetical protein
VCPVFTLEKNIIELVVWLSGIALA